MTKTISVVDLRKKISQVTDEVEYRGTTFILVKHDKPVGKIVPLGTPTNISPEFTKQVKAFMKRASYDLRKLAKK